MSIVFPTHKRDFLAPSRTLQDLKKKLGPIYFDAKLIECPQNAVELCKLIQTLEELDKQKFKFMSEKSRQRRVLQNSLSTRRLSEASSSSLCQVSSRNLNDLTRKPSSLPPGFRFHANGEPKSSEDLTADETTASRSSLQSPSSRPNVTQSSVKFSQHDVVYEEEGGCAAEDDDGATGMRPKGYEELDYSREIEDLELIIRQLAAQLKIQSDNLNGTPSEESTPTVKHNFLRAHSHTDYMLESSLTNSSVNYAYDPEVNYNKEGKPKSLLISRHFTNPTKTSRCHACHFKLKHVGNEFYTPRNTGRSKEKWSIAPRGQFISSPNLALASSTSLTKRASSKAFHTERTSPQQSAAKWNHSLSKAATGKSMEDHRSFSSPSMKMNKKFLEEQAELPYNTSSRSSYRFSSPGPSLVSTSSHWRYLSPEEKSSRVQLLKSQAMRDYDDCQEKVDAFLGKLSQHTIKTRSNQPWRS